MDPELPIMISSHCSQSASYATINTIVPIPLVGLTNSGHAPDSIRPASSATPDPPTSGSAPQLVLFAARAHFLNISASLHALTPTLSRRNRQTRWSGRQLWPLTARALKFFPRKCFPDGVYIVASTCISLAPAVSIPLAVPKSLEVLKTKLVTVQMGAHPQFLYDCRGRLLPDLQWYHDVTCIRAHGEC